MRQVVWRWGLLVNEAMVTRRIRGIESISMDLETIRLPGEDLFYREEDEVLSFKVSDNVVFTTSSSSLSPCAIRAVDAMVSWRDGWSSQDTLSGTSVSPKSSKEALAARLVLAGLILYVPLEEVTACLKISYCAAEIFLLSPSASSSSKSALLESMSNAALKLSGDPSRAVDSTDEDLESGERDLESLDSLWFLDLLTDVLGGLTGVQACLLASLARLTRELIELWGVWRNLSGDLVLAGDPAGVADLLLAESCSGTGKDDWTARLMELSGTLGSSKQRWSNVHNDIKSTSVDWLMVFGMEGKSGGVLVPVRMEMSGPPTGVAAGFSCPADPSTLTAGRGAGPSKSSGSSKRNWELCDDSTTETSAGLSKSVSTTVVGPSTVTGPSTVAEPFPVAGPLPVAEPSPVAGPLPVAEPWSVVGSLPMTVPLRTAGPSLVAEPPLAAGPAPAELSATGAGTGTDSIWICRAGEATSVIVRFSGALDFAGDSWTSRLATNVPPLLSELSRRLSRWLGWDLWSGDARDEDDERDRRSPEEWCWWWREEELDGRTRHVNASWTHQRNLAGPARPLSLRSLLRQSRRDDWCLGDSWRFSSLAFRRPRPTVVRPVGAGPFHRRDAGSHGLGLRWTCDCLRPLGLGRILGLGTLGRKRVPWCV